MAKHKPDTTEYNEHIGQFDDGTYQTGAIHPPKPSSAIIAVLLALVILLGALCSGLGIVNVRLLSALSQAQQATTPLSLDTHPQTTDTGTPLEELELPVPQVPQVEHLSLQIAEAVAEAQLDAQLVLEKSRPCLVTVQCLTLSGMVQSGMGLVLSQDGFLLTNYHIIDGAQRIFVTLPDGSIQRAALVGSDSFPDLAVLYIEAQGLTPAVFSDNRSLQTGDNSYAMEYADGSCQVRSSQISSVSSTYSAKSSSLTLIKTAEGGDAGPVFDGNGYVIGFQVGHVSQYTSGTDADCGGTGLVIPTGSISQIVQSLVSRGQVAGRPDLGLEVEAISKVYQTYWHLPDGLLVTGVDEGSSAQAAGLEEGDILIALDGVAVTTRSQLNALLYNHEIGDVIIAVVCRDEQNFTVKLTVEEN